MYFLLPDDWAIWNNLTCFDSLAYLSTKLSTMLFTILLIPDCGWFKLLEY